MESSNLLKPGEVRVVDYRREEREQTDKEPAPLRIVSWNIERGFQQEGVATQLECLQPDVVLLQEVDVCCDRTGGRDVGAALAQQLGMAYAFVCEFEELRAPERERYARIGQGGGIHGNAILSRFPIHNAWAIVHKHQPFSWEEHGAAVAEPRKGARVALGASLDMRGTEFAPVEKLVCYSVHLEERSGLVGRYSQICDVLCDAVDHSGHDERVTQVIAGDMNTLRSGLARLHPRYWDRRDPWIAFTSEARYWEDVLLAAQCPEQLHDAFRPFFVRNPGFRDPFQKDFDVTVTSWGGLYGAKLDWVLLRGLDSVEHAVGGAAYSDHLWASVDAVVSRHVL